MARITFLVSVITLVSALLSAWLALWLTLVEQQHLPCDAVIRLVAAHETAAIAAATTGAVLDLRVRVHTVTYHDTTRHAVHGGSADWARAVVREGLSLPPNYRGAKSYFELGDTEPLHLERMSLVNDTALHLKSCIRVGEDSVMPDLYSVDVFLLPPPQEAGDGAIGNGKLLAPTLTVDAAGDIMWLDGLPVWSKDGDVSGRDALSRAIAKAVVAAVTPEVAAAVSWSLTPARHATALLSVLDGGAHGVEDVKDPRAAGSGGGGGDGWSLEVHAVPESLHVEVALMEGEPQRTDRLGADAEWGHGMLVAAADASARVAAVASAVADIIHVTTAHRRVWYGALGDEDTIITTLANVGCGGAEAVASCREGYNDSSVPHSSSSSSSEGTGAPPSPLRRRVYVMEHWSMGMIMALLDDADMAGGAVGVEGDVGGDTPQAMARVLLVDEPAFHLDETPSRALRDATSVASTLVAGGGCTCAYVSDGDPRRAVDGAEVADETPRHGAAADRISDVGRRRALTDFGLGRTGFEVAANVVHATVGIVHTALRAMTRLRAKDEADHMGPVCGPHAAVTCACSGSDSSSQDPILRGCIVGVSTGSPSTTWVAGFVPPLAYRPLYMRHQGDPRRAHLSTGCDAFGGLWLPRLQRLPHQCGDTQSAGSGGTNCCSSERDAFAAGCALVDSFGVRGWGRVVLLDDNSIEAIADVCDDSDRGEGPCRIAGNDFDVQPGKRLADEAVAHLRHKLGLARKPRDVFTVTASASAVHNATVIPGHGANGDKDMEAAVGIDGSAIASRSEALDASATSPPDTAAVSVKQTVFVKLLRDERQGEAILSTEVRALRRRWWAAHLHTSLATLVTVCDVFGPPRYRSIDGDATSGGSSTAWRAYRVSRRDVAAMHAAMEALRGAFAAAHAGDVSASLIELRRARLLGALLLRAADAPAPDAELPLLHKAAIYVPAWAPLVLPLLFAVGSAAVALIFARPKGQRST